MNPFGGLLGYINQVTGSTPGSGNVKINSNTNVGGAAKYVTGRDVTPGFNVTKSAPYIGSSANTNSSNGNQPQNPKNQPETPNTPPGQFPTGAYAGGNGASQADPNAVALYDQGINQTNATLGRLDNQARIGEENLTNAFTENLNRLLGAKAMAERDYNTNKEQSTQDNIKARSTIDSNTGMRANALQRLLGSKGAGSSSAARVAAPYAAALEGTRQRSQVADAFGRNMQALDTNFGDYTREWDDSRRNLDTQLYQQRNALQSDIAGKRQNLLNTLAQLQASRVQAAGGSGAASVAAAQPYLNQVNTLGADIDNLGRQYPGMINVANPNYVAPELAQYNTDRGGAPEVAGSALSDTLNPGYLSVLLGSKRREQFAL